MKSMIISAVIGTAILVIHGVSAAVVPVNAVKRNEASAVRSEAIEEAHSLAIKRAVPAFASSVTDSPKFFPTVESDVSSINSGTDTSTDNDSTDKDVSAAAFCVHTDEGFHECGEVMFKRVNAATPSMNDLEKRVHMRDGYPDISDVCKHGKHWAQALNHPSYCTQLNDHNPPDELFMWCYVWVPCNVPNGAKPIAKRVNTKNDVAIGTYETNQLKTRATDSTAADPGCHGKAKPFYFTPGAAAVCNAEIVKGSATYQRYYPGTSWNTGLMHLCFENAGCDGGLQLGP
ncbi:MAG: hypothetical protein Q9166_004978 [cf. Caloplaca sp. 2 TL-2023]